MYRAILALVFIAGIGLFVRHQFETVIRQVTTKQPRSGFATSPARPQESRIKCVMCGGTGRSGFSNFGTLNAPRMQACPSCRGTGWVDNPTYGRTFP
jgi:DnaJ-class molecular chaperone